MGGQLAILDRAEALTRDVLLDATRYLDLPVADENDKTWWQSRVHSHSPWTRHARRRRFR
ncbi:MULTISPECIES: hypothetical protein [unclassified Streptomyces]|uniref:Uncharacterized protein n=1 Tax=Streptomyces sp. NBC_00060 TaxID=2975636 RepID=A0AAU2H9U7_9ACTN